MTSYSSFSRDLSSRCRDILNAYEVDARGNDLEVTLLMAIATSAFTIPFERLNPSSLDHVADDRVPEAVSELGKLQNRDFLAWQTGNSWKIIEGLSAEQIRSTQADAWASPDKRQAIPADKKVGSILAILRNARAHGNIFTYPRPVSRERATKIEDIIFLSKHRDEITGQLTDKYNAVIVSPSDFRTLIFEWIAFLENLKLPSVTFQESI